MTCTEQLYQIAKYYQNNETLKSHNPPPNLIQPTTTPTPTNEHMYAYLNPRPIIYIFDPPPTQTIYINNTNKDTTSHQSNNKDKTNTPTQHLGYGFVFGSIATGLSWLLGQNWGLYLQIRQHKAQIQTIINNNLLIDTRHTIALQLYKIITNYQRNRLWSSLNQTAMIMGSGSLAAKYLIPLKFKSLPYWFLIAFGILSELFRYGFWSINYQTRYNRLQKLMIQIKTYQLPTYQPPPYQPRNTNNDSPLEQFDTDPSAPLYDFE